MVLDPQCAAKNGQPSALSVVVGAEVGGGVHRAAVLGHPRVGGEGVLIKHLLVLRAVIHLDGHLGNPLVHVVVLGCDNERVRRVGKDFVDESGLHQFFERGRARVVDRAGAVGAVKQRRQGRGVGLLENFRELRVKRAVVAVPANDVVGQIRRIRVRRGLERQGNCVPLMSYGPLPGTAAVKGKSSPYDVVARSRAKAMAAWPPWE